MLRNRILELRISFNRILKLSKFKISEQENIFYRNICKLKRFTSNALELLSVGGGLGDLSGKCG